MGMKTPHVTHKQASSLLHNKYVVILGSSIQRGMYKDLVLLLQRDSHLSLSQLKAKGEEEFENDQLLEGGRKGVMNNGVRYKEVRQYKSDHHLVRFYFITRIYSEYVQKILEEFKNGLKPDLVIVNSCVWDISRYGRRWEPEYLENLSTFFGKLRSVLPDEALIVWNLAMPLGQNIIGGFLVPEITDLGPLLRFDVIEANYYSAALANLYGLDVLDMHFLFRFSLQHRMKDGVHWNAVAHRRITCLLLEHVANAWGVDLPPEQPPTVTRWRPQKRRAARLPLLNSPLMAPRYYRGLNRSFPKPEPFIKETYQQPRNAPNSVAQWRPQTRRMEYCLPPATPTKASHYYGGLSCSFTELDTSTNHEKYQLGTRTAHTPGDGWRRQERRADYDLPPLTPSKTPNYYRDMGQSFGEEDFTSDEIYQQSGNVQNSLFNQSFEDHILSTDDQPRSAQNPVSRWRLQERRDDSYLTFNTPSKVPCCSYGVFNQSFGDHNLSTDDQPRSAQSPVSRWRLQERRDDSYLTFSTPSKVPCCSYGGFNCSFGDEDLADGEMYQQPNSVQSSGDHSEVSRWRLQEGRDCSCLTFDTPSKVPCRYGDISRSFAEDDFTSDEIYQKPGNVQNSVLYQSFADEDQDLSTNEMHQLPGSAQSSVSRWRLQERRDDSYLTFNTPSKVPCCSYGGLNRSFREHDEMYPPRRSGQNTGGELGVTRFRLQESRPDYFPTPDTPAKSSHCYGVSFSLMVLSESYNKQAPATTEMHQQSRNDQNNSATRWRPQKRKAEYCLPPAPCLKAPCYYGGLSRSFTEEEPVTSQTYQQPRSTQTSVPRWRLPDRQTGHSHLLPTPSKSPYYHRLPTPSKSPYYHRLPTPSKSPYYHRLPTPSKSPYYHRPPTPSKSPYYHRPPTPSKSPYYHRPPTPSKSPYCHRPPTPSKSSYSYEDTRYRLPERRANDSPLLETPSKPSHYYGGLNQSFGDPNLSPDEMYQQHNGDHNGVSRWSLQGRRDGPATNEMARQPRRAQVATVSRWRSQEPTVDHCLTPVTPTKPSYAHCLPRATPTKTCYAHCLPPVTQTKTSYAHCLPRATPTKTSQGYGVTSWKPQERRAATAAAYSLAPPAVSPLKDPYHYEEPSGFDSFERYPDGQYPCKDTDLRQPHLQKGGYVMRKKYFRHAQYRPY